MCSEFSVARVTAETPDETVRAALLGRLGAAMSDQLEFVATAAARDRLDQLVKKINAEVKRLREG